MEYTNPVQKRKIHDNKPKCENYAYYPSLFRIEKTKTDFSATMQRRVLYVVIFPPSLAKFAETTGIFS